MHLPKLETTLYANAGFSLLSGLALVVFAETVSSNLITLPTLVLRVFGIGLLLFAADVFYVARNLRQRINSARIIMWADVLWVVATPIALVLLADNISGVGNWLLIDIAIIVGMLAILEWAGIRLTEPVNESVSQ